MINAQFPYLNPIPAPFAEAVSPTSNTKSTVQKKYRPVGEVIEFLTDYRPPTGTWLRWIIKGKGGIQLKALQLGGQWRTTVENVQDFLESTTKAEIDSRNQAPVAPARSRSEAARARAIARAEKELASTDV